MMEKKQKMNAEIEKKAEELAIRFVSGATQDDAIDYAKTLILEACRFTERVTMERAAGICREVREGDPNAYAYDCEVVIEAAAREGK